MSELFNEELYAKLVSIGQSQTIDPLQLAEQLVVNLQNEFVGTLRHADINFNNLINLDSFLQFVSESNINIPRNLEPVPSDISIVLDQQKFNALIENLTKSNEQVAEQIKNGFVQYGNLWVHLKGLGAYIQSLYNEATVLGGVNGHMIQSRLNALQNEMVQKGLITKTMDLSGQPPAQSKPQEAKPEGAGATLEKTKYTQEQAPGQVQKVQEVQPNVAEAFKESNPAGSAELVVPFVGNIFSIQRINNFGTQIGRLISNPKFSSQLDLADDANILGQSVNQLSALLQQWNQASPQQNKAGFMLPTDLESINQHLNAGSSASYQLLTIAKDIVNQILVIYETLLQNNIFASIAGPQIQNQMTIGHNLIVKLDDWAGSFRRRAPV